MQKKIWLGTLVAAAAVLWLGSAAWAQDSYVVAGGGAPVGTKITSLPAAGLTLSNPGFYFLAGNLRYMSSTGNAITIATDDVTLDLMGFTLTGPGGSTSVNGVYMNGRANVEIRNGTISSFYVGVYEVSLSGSKHRIINVRACNNNTGIQLTGNSNLVKNCSAPNYSTGGIVVGSGLIVGSEATSVYDGGSIIVSTHGITLLGPGSVLGSTACNNDENFFLGRLPAFTSILADGNSAYHYGTANYFDNGPGVDVTSNNSGQ